MKKAVALLVVVLALGLFMVACGDKSKEAIDAMNSINGKAADVAEKAVADLKAAKDGKAAAAAISAYVAVVADYQKEMTGLADKFKDARGDEGKIQQGVLESTTRVTKALSSVQEALTKLAPEVLASDEVVAALKKLGEIGK